jgi:hypothetical protein
MIILECCGKENVEPFSEVTSVASETEAIECRWVGCFILSEVCV